VKVRMRSRRALGVILDEEDEPSPPKTGTATPASNRRRRAGTKGNFMGNPE
jgi:hypothetical protein